MKCLLISLVTLVLANNLSTLAIPNVSYHSDGRLISVHLSENWMKAVSKCKSRGETLASTEDLKELDSDIWKQQGLLNKELWTSDTFIHTPFITKIGCFQMEENYLVAVDLKGYGNTSVAVCYAYCSENQYFALSGFNCICNPSKNRTMKIRQNCSSPDATKRQKTLDLYQVSSNKIPGKITEDTYYGIFECRMKLGREEGALESVPSSDMSNFKSFYGVCLSSKDEVLPISKTFKDWESANTACEELTGQPLVTKLNTSHCKILNEKLSINIYTDAVFVTGNRTYRSHILVPDVLVSGGFGLVHCKTFNRTKSSNWTEFEILKEEKCDEGKRPLFALKNSHTLLFISVQKYICNKKLTICTHGNLYHLPVESFTKYNVNKRCPAGRTRLCTVSDTATGNEYDSKLIMKIMTPLLFLLIVSIFACARYRIRVHLRRNQEKKAKPKLEINYPCLYNHTESSQRISIKKAEKVYTCDSEDSGEDSYFSEDSVEAESQKLNEEVVLVTPTISDDSCDYSFASASQHAPLKDITAGATALCLTYTTGAIPQDNSFKPKTLFAEETMANEIP